MPKREEHATVARRAPRAAEAAIELLDQDLPTTHTAVDSGFTERNAFTSAFSRHAGLAPSE